jgi:hypothetical protein
VAVSKQDIGKAYDFVEFFPVTTGETKAQDEEENKIYKLTKEINRKEKRIAGNENMLFLIIVCPHSTRNKLSKTGTRKKARRNIPRHIPKG